MRKMTVRDLDLKGKKVLVRVDFNVPMKGKTISDETKIKAALPTIRYILEQGGSPILLSHLGRPKGRDPELSLAPVAKTLEELLGKPVRFVEESIGTVKPGEVILLENLRFHPAEKAPEKDPTFAKKLAALGDCYVNDAFGSSHRAHSSTYFVPKEFPGSAVAGFLMEKELRAFGSLLQNPRRPFYAIIGGAKISSKIEILRALVEKVDGVLIAGAMAHTFFVAQGIPVGDSLYEKDFVETAQQILTLYDKKKVPLLLPVDVVVTQKVASGEKTKVVETIPDGWIGVDIGPKTISRFSDFLARGKTIFWNGPVGICEIPEFAKGTEALASAIGELGVEAIVGGGDSVAAIHALSLEEGFTHLSTGGGASLELIEKGTLPGIEALSVEGKGEM
jgi:phosphoglycerate kinase